MADDRAVIHFVVPVKPGQPGLASKAPKNAAALPPVLQKALTGADRAYVFACDSNLVPEYPSPHVGSNDPGAVNCLRCKATAAWKDAPEISCLKKFPDAPEAASELDKYLAPEPAPVSTAVTAETPQPPKTQG